MPGNDDRTMDRKDSDTSTGAESDAEGNPADAPLPEKQAPAEEGALPEELISPESQAGRLASAVNDVQLLIRHAAGAGKEVPKGLIETISQAARDLGKTEFDAAREAEFWDTVAKITHAVAPITIDSILYTKDKYGSARDKEGWLWIRNLRHVGAYLIFTLLTLFFLIFTQIRWVEGTNLMSAIDDYSKGRATLILDLVRLDLEIATQAPKTAKEDVDEIKSKIAGKLNEIDQKSKELQASRVLLENWVSDYITDPVRPVEPGYFASDAMIAKWEKDVEAWHTKREVAEESKTHDLVFQQAKGVLLYMAGYYLPLAYGLLGALAFVLRSLSRELSGLSFSRGSHVQFALRLLLGLLAGISVGWFLRPELDTGGLLDISPFALAFLAGYSVELVFTAMDTIIDAFSGESSTRKPA